MDVKESAHTEKDFLINVNFRKKKKKSTLKNDKKAKKRKKIKL